MAAFSDVVGGNRPACPASSPTLVFARPCLFRPSRPEYEALGVLEALAETRDDDLTLIGPHTSHVSATTTTLDPALAAEAHYAVVSVCTDDDRQEQRVDLPRRQICRLSLAGPWLVPLQKNTAEVDVLFCLARYR
ncbi:hypothetical protein ColLi_05237 [Colletotrichum liriopes]|uniref:Uncharacterized protein n=1 Tax=Colletotrichum liriopes TaxID=708192 RepID=A0AA37GKJ7_9PEZI|nr:hypothetical protein ColLi_05237 [Colletotrichum liriopes]